ncbi:zinc finger protein 771-like [Anoplopoma fimbria]|uniref:zinc finger protein 771-like n=1 Tax=Anoplopoma fimbria TaxID=229290 RepID=UPI0023EB6867|nr:zinc finger protein 771-like [Anoplopoma fimbria]
MSKAQILRCLVNQRLTAAAEEICVLFERTIAEYEEERSRSKEENERQRKLLDAVFNPQLQATADVQQEWTSSLNQEDPEPTHIKEEQEELWTCQEGEQLQEPEEADINFSLTSITVKTEEDVGENAQSSQLHESQDEEKQEAAHLKTDADEELCGGSESASNSVPSCPFQPATHDENSSSSESETNGETSSSSDSETDDETSSSSESETDASSIDWDETVEPQSGSNPLQNNDVPVSHDECKTGCVEGARSLGHEEHLQKLSPLGVHSDRKRFSCPVCKTSFSSSAHLVRHVRTHTGEKPFSCSVCGKRFALNHHLRRHLIVHTGEKPFSCSLCSKQFSHHSNLKQHLTVHTREKPFSCSFCGKGFSHHSNLKLHLTVHTGEKPFRCSVCGRGFAQKEQLRQHMVVHTGEKPFSCSVCGRGFTQHGSLTRHMSVHTGEKPFSCSVCGREFTQHGSLKRHLTGHRGETV